MTSFAVIGAGWRAELFWRLAPGTGTRCVGAVVPTPRTLEVATFSSVAECLERARPDFFVTAVPWQVTPEMIRQVVGRGVPVLAETPPAPDVAGLQALWADVGDSGLVQVAEQYPLLPSQAARSAAVRSGMIGTVTQVQVSSTHQYHAVALMRALLQVGRTPVTVRATRFSAPLVNPLTRDGWTDDLAQLPASTVLATLDFGAGRSGVYDFTDNQWHNQLRFRRLLVRGSQGELHDDEVVRLVAPRTIVRSELVRRQTGYDLDLDGFDTDHVTLGSDVLFRNPYPGRRWSDEEIAIASLLDATAAWVHDGGAPPYPLAEGAHDQLIALAIEQAADTDRPVTTALAPWA